jgi:2-methylisocitrate lyase-like PEP mutase family enzyme
MAAATKLRQFFENEKSLLMCPGVYDGFSARIALSVGFDCLYMVHLFFHPTDSKGVAADLNHRLERAPLPPV